MALRSKKMSAVIVALALGATTVSVMAQGRGPGGRGPDGYGYGPGPGRGGPGYGHDHRGPPPGRGDFHDGRQDLRPDRMADRRGFPQPRRDWHRGGYVPREYRDRQYVIDNYRGYGLRPPPRGYQWVGVGGDFVLAAIATGIIASIISH